jgi:hypothetical protein
VSGQSAGDAAFATTLAKGLVVLEAFEDGASVLGKMELSARAGIPRPAVRLLVGGRGDGTRNCARAPGGQVRVLRRGVFKIRPRQNNDAIPISKTGSGAKRSSGATLPPAPHASGQVFDSIRTLEGWTIPAGASERSRARQRQSRMPYRRMEALPDLGENRENMQIARRKDKRCFVGSIS